MTTTARKSERGIPETAEANTTRERFKTEYPETVQRENLAPQWALITMVPMTMTAYERTGRAGASLTIVQWKIPPRATTITTSFPVKELIVR